jgi:hypothetical protein
VRSCFVYDPANGKIVHVHKNITIAGGLERSDAEIEARARKFATRTKRNDIDALRVIFAEDRRARGRRYRVDTATLQIVEVG